MDEDVAAADFAEEDAVGAVVEKAGLVPEGAVRPGKDGCGAFSGG